MDDRALQGAYAHALGSFLRGPGGTVPNDFYPAGWLERAGALEAGAACPGDWDDPNVPARPRAAAEAAA